ncbi:MAG TPA: dienelactone hydrolase family protein [Pseudonocardiaceae bacterium]|jgi:carboxymethylenebutenolidase|nr:dienelactone hydrolase family protein [Pseudonocardiaceae bacterium]
MTEIRTETIALTDGRSLRLTVAGPQPAVRGGLIVLHEARGVTDAVRGLVDSLAAEGWLAVAPHLYRADHAEEFDGADVDHQVSKLSGDTVLADTDATAVWLADAGVPADRLGVIGFDLGGAVAMVVASSRTVGAAVSVAGGGITEPLSDGLPALIDVAGELTCPWLGLYGDRDTTISPDQVEKLRDAAAGASVATEVVRFAEASNRFDSDPTAAAEAWQRTLNWFDLHLR